MEILAYLVGLVGLFVILMGMAAIVIQVVAISSIINGYVLKILWGWFIIPIFHLPALNIPQAIGVSMMVSFLTHRLDVNDESKEKDSDEAKKAMVKLFGYMVLYPLILLAVGAIVRRFL